MPLIVDVHPICLDIFIVREFLLGSPSGPRKPLDHEKFITNKTAQLKDGPQREILLFLRDNIVATGILCCAAVKEDYVIILRTDSNLLGSFKAKRWCSIVKRHPMEKLPLILEPLSKEGEDRAPAFSLIRSRKFPQFYALVFLLAIVFIVNLAVFGKKAKFFQCEVFYLAIRRVCMLINALPVPLGEPFGMLSIDSRSESVILTILLWIHDKEQNALMALEMCLEELRLEYKKLEEEQERLKKE
uniref:PH domain-containing protein n=1 Tax=Angiostrongylus cantonensis TaxID=6313 RepID=A0A0K0DPG8_ANGCA